jgi:hypothetical protein
MPIVALTRVNFANPPGDLGNRLTMAMSTCISNDEWHIEADYTNGAIGDVSLYRNTKATTPKEPPNWVWYGAIPTANIKGYTIKTPPAPSAAYTNEPQATNPPATSQAARAAK